MLSDKKLILDFIEECRNHQMIKDDYHEVSEKMFTKLYQIEDVLKTTDDGRKLFSELEDLIFQTIDKAKETYFEYGENYLAVAENKFMTELSKEA